MAEITKFGGYDFEATEGMTYEQLREFTPPVVRSRGRRGRK
jgi:hypothetical protein